MALSLSGAMAQQASELTLEDFIPGGATYHKYIPENKYGLDWCGERCVRPEIDSLFLIDPASGRQTLVATREEVNKTLEENGLTAIPSFYNISFRDGKAELMEIKRVGEVYLYNLKNNTVRRIAQYDKEAQNVDRNEASRHIAYTMGSDLHVVNYDEQTGQTTEVAKFASEYDGIVYGQSVHRNEFGIMKGTFWSPDGDKLAFYKMDESMVTKYPMVNIDARVAEEVPIRYPMAGMTSHKVYVGVCDMADGRTVYLETGDPTDRYFTNISWSPDSKKLYVIELNRDQNHARLVRYDAASGKKEKELFEERHEKYVEPLHPLTFLKNDDGKFIYQSQRDGYNHLYIYDTDGNFVKQLTGGEWMVKDIIGFDAKGDNLFYTSTEVSSLDNTLYKVNIKNGKRQQVTCAAGTHQVKLSPSTKYMIDAYTAHDVPRIINIARTDNKGKVVNLLTARDPYEGIDVADVSCGKIKAADGTTDLYYQLTTPKSLDPNKKYPVIIYVYGGPHLQLVTNTWRWASSGWNAYMAQNGYVVFELDNRGSANRGLAFENSTFRKLGVEECADQMKGVEFLKSLPYVDADRIGVHGWSFGGHMTTALMLRHPETFKVGVAGGPVIDWALYEVMYGERYMDTPQANPEGYEQCNLNNLAGNLKGRLLMIHDYNDKTCVPQHALQFIKACVDKRTYPDLFIYPGHDHNVRGKDRVHLYQKVSSYFMENL